MAANNKPTREADSIHRAMVIIAGIEMENPEDPPRLWTALEDAYDALSDALGTDGDTTADEEEAKATGRHFVVRSSGDRAKLRKALELARLYISLGPEAESRANVKNGQIEMLHAIDVLGLISSALVGPPRNCDVGTELEQAERYRGYCDKFTLGGMHCETCPCCGKIPYGKCEFAWANMPYEANKEGGTN